MSFPGFALSGTSACRRRPLPGPFIYRSSLTSSRCLPAPRAAPAGGASRADRVTAVGARGRHVRLDRREAVRPPAPQTPAARRLFPPVAAVPRPRTGGGRAEGGRAEGGMLAFEVRALPRERKSRPMGGRHGRKGMGEVSCFILYCCGAWARSFLSS